MHSKNAIFACTQDLQVWYTFWNACQLRICAFKNEILLFYNHSVSFLFPFVYIYSLSSLFYFCYCCWWPHQLHRTSWAAPAAAHLQHLGVQMLVSSSGFHFIISVMICHSSYHHHLPPPHHIISTYTFLWYFIICSITSSFHLLIFQSLLHHLLTFSLPSSYSYSSSSSYQSSSYFIYPHHHHHNISLYVVMPDSFH